MLTNILNEKREKYVYLPFLNSVIVFIYFFETSYIPLKKPSKRSA